MGYCRKRGGKWYYTLKWTDANGVKQQCERVGGLTKPDCEKAWRDAMVIIDTLGIYAKPCEKTVEECLKEWLDNDVRINLKDNTVDSYESTIRIHLIPEFGKRALKTMTTAVIQDWLNQQRELFARSTLKTFYAVLKKSMEWFLTNRKYITTNPMDHVRIPRYDKIEEPVRSFSPDEMKAIFAKFDCHHRFYFPIVLSYMTGMRLGECLALTWDDVDQKKRTIKVVTTLYDKKGNPKRAASPKSRASVRVISYGQKLHDELIRQQWQQNDSRNRAGTFYNESRHVCTDDDGTLLTSNDLRYFGQWCHTQFGSGSFHSLRHTHATMLREKGFDLEYISKRLGHSSISTTANIYVDITAEQEKEAVRLMDKIL
jgi:integrase